MCKTRYHKSFTLINALFGIVLTSRFQVVGKCARRDTINLKNVIGKINMCDCQNVKTYKKVTHCIFDLDGTVIDTEQCFRMVQNEMLGNFGKELTPELSLKTHGLGTADLWKSLIDEFDLQIDLKDIKTTYRARCKEVITNCPLLPGVERLVRHLHKHSIPLAIATSSHPKNVEIKTRHIEDLISMFSHVTSAVDNPDVSKGKPSPEVYLSCLSQFADKPKPEQCLAFEDSLNGLTSALRAGLQCVMINNFIPREVSEDATLNLDSLEDFRPEIFGLPPF